MIEQHLKRKFLLDALQSSGYTEWEYIAKARTHAPYVSRFEIITFSVPFVNERVLELIADVINEAQPGMMAAMRGRIGAFPELQFAILVDDDVSTIMDIVIKAYRKMEAAAGVVRYANAAGYSP